MISHGLWQRRFGGAAGVIGRTVTLNDESYEVVGVLPRNFYFLPSREIDLWLPASFSDSPSSTRKSRRCARFPA
jgi:putative ABC transport system permease protein